MSETTETSSMGSIALLIAEAVTKEIIIVEAPKWIAAIQKDIDALGDIHVIKKEFLKLILNAVKEAQTLSAPSA